MKNFSNCESVFIHGSDNVKKLNEMRLKVCCDSNGKLLSDIPSFEEVFIHLLYMCDEMDDEFFIKKYNEVDDIIDKKKSEWV